MGDGGRNPRRWAGKSCPFQRETSCYVYDGGSTLDDDAQCTEIEIIELQCNADIALILDPYFSMETSDRRQTLCVKGKGDRG